MSHFLLTKVGVKKVGFFPFLKGPNRRSWKLSVNSQSPKRQESLDFLTSLSPHLSYRSKENLKEKFYAEHLFLLHSQILVLVRYSILESFPGFPLGRLSAQARVPNLSSVLLMKTLASRSSSSWDLRTCVGWLKILPRGQKVIFLRRKDKGIRKISTFI